FASRCPIRQARKTLRVSGCCSYAATGVADRRLTDNSVPVVEKTLHAWHEPAAHIDRGFRHHALAICLHWARNQTIVFSPTGGILGPCERKGPRLAIRFVVFDHQRACNIDEGQWRDFGPRNCLSDLRPVPR